MSAPEAGRVSIVGRTVAGLALFCALALSPHSASAGTGLRTAFWSGSNFSIQLNSNNKVVGFWRVLLRSMNQCPSLVTPFFNQSLRSKTIEVQQTWQTNNPPFGTLPADGIINHNDWDGFEFAKAPGGPGVDPVLRYQYDGYTDGFGTQYWTYYGGGSLAHLGWNPYAQQNYFDPYVNDHQFWETGWYLLPASSSATMGNYPCDA